MLRKFGAGLLFAGLCVGSFLAGTSAQALPGGTFGGGGSSASGGMGTNVCRRCTGKTGGADCWPVLVGDARCWIVIPGDEYHLAFCVSNGYCSPDNHSDPVDWDALK